MLISMNLRKFQIIIIQCIRNPHAVKKYPYGKPLRLRNNSSQESKL